MSSGIDHFAALVVDDGAFEVFSLADEAGSVLADGTFSEGRKGKPASSKLKLYGRMNREAGGGRS